MFHKLINLMENCQLKFSSESEGSSRAMPLCSAPWTRLATP